MTSYGMLVARDGFLLRLHIEEVLGFEEVERVLDDLDFYIKKIEEI